MVPCIKKHPSLRYEDEIKSMGRPLKAFEIDYFSRARVTVQGKFSCLGSDAQFVKTYLSERYFNSSMHVDQKNLGNLILWDLPSLRGRSLELHQVKQDFQLFNGFTLVNKTQHYCDYYHFASHNRNPNLLSLYLSQMENFILFSQYFDEKIAENKPLKESFDFSFDIDYEKGAYEIDTPEFNENLHPAFQNLLGKNVKIIFNNKTIAISDRELQILHWLSLGKTSEEAALLLGITKATVNKHVDNIKLKSGCYTLFQLGELFAAIKKHPLFKLKTVI